MSHGGGDDNIEPDLTPLLDLVMQLLMFFIVTVRVVKEDTNQDVQLPESSSATLVIKADVDALFINQKSNRGGKFSKQLPMPHRERLAKVESVILVQGRQPMDPLDLNVYLRDLHNRAEKEAGGADKVKTIIHFRADGDLDLGELFKVMNLVKTAGYTQLKIRAVRKQGRG